MGERSMGGQSNEPGHRSQRQLPVDRSLRRTRSQPEGVWPDLVQRPATAQPITRRTAPVCGRAQAGRAFESACRADSLSGAPTAPAGAWTRSDREQVALSRPKLQRKLHERATLLRRLQSHSDPAWVKAGATAAAFHVAYWPEDTASSASQTVAAAVEGDFAESGQALPAPCQVVACGVNDICPTPLAPYTDPEPLAPAMTEDETASASAFVGMPGSRRVVSAAEVRRTAGSSPSRGCHQERRVWSALCLSLQSYNDRASVRRRRAWTAVRLYMRSLVWCLPVWCFCVGFTLLEGYVFAPIITAEYHFPGHPADLVGPDRMMLFDTSTSFADVSKRDEAPTRVAFLQYARLRLVYMYLRFAVDSGSIVAFELTLMGMLFGRHVLLHWDVSLPVLLYAPLYTVHLHILSHLDISAKFFVIIVPFCLLTALSIRNAARRVEIPVRNALLWVLLFFVVLAGLAIIVGLLARVVQTGDESLKALWLVAMPLISEAFNLVLVHYVLSGDVVWRMLRHDASCAFQFVAMLPFKMLPLMQIRLVVNRGSLLSTLRSAALQATQEACLRLTRTKRSYWGARLLCKTDAAARLETLDPFWRELQAVCAVAETLVGLFVLVWVPVIWVAFERHSLSFSLGYDSNRYVDGWEAAISVLIQLLLSVLVDVAALYHETAVQELPLERAWGELYSRSVVLGAAWCIILVYLHLQASLMQMPDCSLHHSSVFVDELTGRAGCSTARSVNSFLSTDTSCIAPICYCPCHGGEYSLPIVKAYCDNMVKLVISGQFNVTSTIGNSSLSASYREWLLGNATGANCVAQPF